MKTLNYQTFVTNMVQENSYLVWDDSGYACLIDPGFFNSSEQKMLIDFLDNQRLTLVRSIATHLHFDHVLGARFIADRFGIPTEVPSEEIKQLPSIEQQFVTFGIPLDQESYRFDPQPLPEDTVRFGDIELKILKAPGHSPAHVTFWHKESQTLFCGDVLFRNGFGRYDLWGGDYKTLMDSISYLLTLDPETVVLPGHGQETTIGDERKNF